VVAAFVLAAAFVVFVDEEEAKFTDADTSVAKDSGAPAFDGAVLADAADAEAAVFAAAEVETLAKAFAIIGVLCSSAYSAGVFFRRFRFFLSLFCPMVTALVLYNVATAVAIMPLLLCILLLLATACWPADGRGR
jgi:hypothetical protein